MTRNVKGAMWALLIVCLASAVTLIFIAGRDRELDVLNWNDYVGQNTNKDFEKSYAVKVKTKNYVSNEQAYSFLTSIGAAYDVVFPSDYMMDRLVREKRLEPIGDLFAKVTPTVIDQGIINEFRRSGWDSYCVPYLRGNTGFAVNVRSIGRAADSVSWTWLASPDFSGRMIVIDDARQVLGSVLIELGFDANSVKGDDLAKAISLFRRVRPKVVEFAGDSIKESARAGAADVAFAWSGDALQLEGSLPNWRYSLPRAGGVRFQDGVCLIRGAKHKDMALEYLKFVLTPSVHVDILETTLYPTSNREAREKASARYRKLEETASDDDVKTQRLRNLDEASLDLIRRAWEDAKR